MTGNKNVDHMILDLMDTHVPILVSYVEEECGGYSFHVIIPDDGDKAISFDYAQDGFLWRVKSYNLTFDEVVAATAKEVLAKGMGSHMELYGI